MSEVILAPAIVAEMRWLHDKFISSHAAGFQFGMPNLSPAVMGVINALPADDHRIYHGGDAEGYSYVSVPTRSLRSTEAQCALIQFGTWPIVGSGDSQYQVYDPAAVDWSVAPILFVSASVDTNHVGVYTPGGAFQSYMVTEDGSSWRQFITAMVIIIGGYFGGTYLSETFGTGVGTEAVSGMDLAADAGMGSVNSGGYTWGGMPTGAEDVAVGDYLDFSDIYDNIDYSGVDGGGWDTGTIDWGGGNYDWSQYDTTSLFPDASSTAPVGPDYPIPEIQISPANVSTGISYQLPSLATIKEVMGLALTAASMVRAFQQSGGQVQDPSASNRAADCATGMILTRSSTGQVTAMRPAVGVATVTTDSGLIINNGDGTYMCISPTGQQTTRSYSTTPTGGVTPGGGGMFAGIDPKMLMIGGAALVGVLLLSQRRR
jgi:hypothetical protein